MIGSEQATQEAQAKSGNGYLGVTCSLTGKFWYQRGVVADTKWGENGSAQQIDRMGLALAQGHNLPDIIGRLLALRGIDLENIDGFLAPSLRRDLPDPSQFLDLDRAANRLAEAIIQNEPIAVLGDYDVDGGTSSAVLVLYGRCLSRNISVTIPDRLTEGYGPNRARIDQIAQSGAKIVLMLDCGTTAHEQVAYANQLGLTVIICDHHISETALPPAFAVINPNRLDQPKGFGDLAAVAVTFMLVVGLNRELRQRGFFTESLPEPDLKQFLDLVCAWHSVRCHEIARFESDFGGARLENSPSPAKFRVAPFNRPRRYQRPARGLSFGLYFGAALKCRRAGWTM